MTHQVFERIHCAYKSDGDGDPLVLVHGIGARGASWGGVVNSLKRNFRCITYDLRGHGDSPLPNAPFGLDDLVEDLEALRISIGIERMHVVGHSLGGMIGPAYAYKYPDRVISLGLLSTAAFRSEEDSAKVLAIVDAMEKQGVEPMLDSLVQRWFTDEFKAANPEVVQWRREQVLTTDERIFLNVFRIYAETEMAPWLHQVRVPSLICTGEMDGGCSPRLNQKIADALPHSSLVVLDGLKHAIQLEAPVRLAAEIKLFIESQVKKP
ncbi:alpha/beta fold hydrolase [Ottowia thiooxydans]|uniref:alpha/beta fold hydrolase n=1 Tax=Ottowia thiooxydans TaxID=219182 RepID=UPI00055DDB50|nr:alpha/beta hydrolase [Ottowia thiooxydans]